MTYLDGLLASRQAAVARAKERRPLALLRPRSPRTDRRDFAAAIAGARAKPAIVAEFKRRSPSAAYIASGADPRRVAQAYERGGAAAISVLTEPEHFGGGFGDLREAREAALLPVLCKDFVVDEYQVWEAAAEGADAILLIACALGAQRLHGCIALAAELGLAALVEVHDEAEIGVAARSGARIIGVNNRDLRTFEVDTSTALRLRPRIPDGTLAIAESGYKTAQDVARCAAAGYDAVLVGEALMRDADPERALGQLHGASV